MKTIPKIKDWATTFREVRGEMSQSQAAYALCDCPITTIQGWEQGRREPPAWMQALILGWMMNWQVRQVKKKAG